MWGWRRDLAHSHTNRPSRCVSDRHCEGVGRVNDNVMQFPAPSAGNGAREALIAIGDMQFDCDWADWLLAELYVRGFKVVPIRDQ